MQNEVVELYLDDIIPNRFQPREKFDENALKELSTSIKEHGVIQPIIVRKIGEKYEIIAGERRYKASALAGLTKIPAIIRNLDDKEASKVALLENLQRKDLTAIEEARTYQKILELDDMTQEQLGRTMGKSQAAIANKLRLLALADEVQEALLNDEISERHARSLLNIDNSNDQVEMLNKIIRNRMTVRELDQAIKELKRGEQVTLEVEEPTKEAVPTPVAIPTEITESELVTEPEIKQPVQEDKRITIEDLLANQKETTPVMPDPVIPTVEIQQDMTRPAVEPMMQENKVETLEMPETKKPEVPKNTFIPDYIAEPEKVETLEPVPTPTQDQAFIEQFKLKDAINLVRNVVPEIQQKGMKAEVQEFDLGGKYQIIININKD